MLLTALVALAGQAVVGPRFELASPLPTIPGVMIDAFANGVGLASQTARAKNLQARVLWIDATANIDRYNTEPKIVALVERVARSGFNTIVLDVKPISGQVIYDSKIAPKLIEWRGQSLPREFDPVPVFVRECRSHRLSFLASFNAFSEGHQLLHVGPGYQEPDRQTVLYVPTNRVRIRDLTYALAESANRQETGRIAVFTGANSLGAFKTGFVVTMRSDRTVVDGFEPSAFRGKEHVSPTIPKGGIALYGDGDAGEFLRSRAIPGTKLVFETEASFVKITDRPQSQYPLMMNPLDERNQEANAAILREFVGKYNVDGVLYDDRLRFAGLDADFSPDTRALFEQHMGKKLSWPNDVFRYTLNPNLVRGIEPGRFYSAWMSWRTDQMRRFVKRMSDTVKSTRPDALFGVYAGSWYGEYPALGSNYAAPGIDAGFWFLTPDYAKTGFAPNIDLLITGCYYPTATMYEAMGKAQGIGSTVEAAGMLTNRLVRDQAWAYAGIDLQTFQGDPDGLERALQAACASTQGVMVFDLSHNIDPMWPVFARAFSQPRRPPHEVAGLLADVRRRRKAVDATGAKLPPIIIAAGSAGTGQ